MKGQAAPCAAGWVARVVAGARRRACNGRDSEARALLAAAVSRDSSGTLLNELGIHQFERGDMQGAEQSFLALLRLANLNSDCFIRDCALSNLAVVCREQGHSARAASLQQQLGGSAARATPPAAGGASIGGDLSNRANDAVLSGDYDLAERLFLAAWSHDRRHGSAGDQADDCGGLGLVAALQGRHAQALTWFAKSAELHAQAADLRGLGCDLMHAGLVYESLGRLSLAGEAFRAAIGHFQQVGATHLAEKARSALLVANRCLMRGRWQPSRN